MRRAARLCIPHCSWLSSSRPTLGPRSSLQTSGKARFLATSPEDFLHHSQRPLPPVFQVWAANTALGKTVLSAALLRSNAHSSLYLKPVQSGFPQDDDAALVQVNAPHSTTATLFTYEQPVSPDLAARSVPGEPLLDDLLLSKTTQALQQFMHQYMLSSSPHSSLALVETAGGVLSPVPSGSLQADLYRPLRLPAILVGDSSLGGISATLSAYEALCIRGYHVPAIVFFASQQGLENELSVDRHIDKSTTSVFQAPPIPPESVPLADYLAQDDTEAFFTQLLTHLSWSESFRNTELQNMAKEAAQVFWYPFTQHTTLGDIKVFDSAHDNNIKVYNPQLGVSRDLWDAMGSWWTNGVGHGNANLAKAIGAAAGRYGHVMFAEAVNQPALTIAKRLLRGPGAGWASRVFFSDDGSTAVEVALKMAFRKRRVDFPDRAHLPVKIVGLCDSYHGDTLGVMDCSEESDFNKLQTPWYESRGIHFNAPTVALKNGVWTVRGAADWMDGDTEMTFKSQVDVFDMDRDTGWYSKEIARRLDRVMETGEVELGALVVEPVLLGAGGMQLVDPAFQRALVRECRARGIPIVFDEIFTGLWRLGCMSGAELLGCEPDIAAYGKLLTGGTVPIATTLAREEVLRAFDGASKREALLHGHSYTAHAIGCAAAVQSMREYDRVFENGGTKRTYWGEEYARELSGLEGVERVSVIGTVLAVEMESEQDGYAATGAQEVVKRLREKGIFTRPLGNVVYLMCSPVTGEEECRTVEKTVMGVLEGLGKKNCNSVGTGTGYQSC